MEEIEETEIEKMEKSKGPKKVIRPKKVEQQKSKNPKSLVLVAVLAAIIGALGMYLFIYYVMPLDNTQTIVNKSEKEVTVTDTGIADAVEKLYNAVVVVEVYVNNQMSASGTGFVYKTEKNKAYILTNNHVIDGKDNKEVRIKFTNGNEEVVNIEGADVYSDLAVLSVAADKIISVADIGSTSNMRLGDTVFTIGAPLDTEYYWTVTRGVLSGKDRMVEVSTTGNGSTSDYVMRVLQTDASINSGNSGGPIANANGEVIGITNMKLVSSGVEGIGFAIPIEDATSYADDIISGKKIEHPKLGISMGGLSSTQEKWELFMSGVSVNTERTSGVVVAAVESGSPADKAGLKRGDIIFEMDGTEVKNVATLRYYLYKHSVGDTIKLTVERNGKNQEIQVKLTATMK